MSYWHDPESFWQRTLSLIGITMLRTALGWFSAQPRQNRRGDEHYRAALAIKPTIL